MRSLRFLLLFLLVGFLHSAFAAEKPSNQSGKWKAVEDAMGRSGQAQPDGTMKFSMPRKDLKVTVDGADVKPGLALGSWAAFQESKGQTVVMGDLVLTEDEVTPVIAALPSPVGWKFNAVAMPIEFAIVIAASVTCSARGTEI